MLLALTVSGLFDVGVVVLELLVVLLVTCVVVTTCVVVETDDVAGGPIFSVTRTTI